MRRRSVLPESAGKEPVGARCWGCDSANPPAFLCPSCPKRGTQEVKPFNHGWKSLMERDREMGRLLLQDARNARRLASLNFGDPGYAEADAEYVRSGIALARTRAKRNGWPDPVSPEHDADGYLKPEYLSAGPRQAPSGDVVRSPYATARR